MTRVDQREGPGLLLPQGSVAASALSSIMQTVRNTPHLGWWCVFAKPSSTPVISAARPLELGHKFLTLAALAGSSHAKTHRALQ